jgi:biopolymer transport protein ExbD
MTRRRRLRRRTTEYELNITAFLNLMVVLVPFLLVTAVFSRITVLDLALPGPGGGAPAEDRLRLEVTVRADRIEVADRGGEPIVIPNRAGGYNLDSLSEVLKAVKARYPAQTDATILLERDIPYETMIHVMDAVRVGTIVQAASAAKVELFPEISIGDAPPAAGGA